MNKFFFRALALLFLLLCSCETGNNNTEPPKPPPFGWRSAGLIPDKDSLNDYGNGFMQITHSKSYLFARDAKIDDPSNTTSRANRIFMSRQGTEIWKEIKLPDSLSSAFHIYGDERGLYVGSYGTGQLWFYEIEANKWEKIFDIERVKPQSYSVHAISKFNNRLVINLAGYDSNAVNTASSRVFHLQTDGSWKNISPPDSLKVCKNPYTGKFENPFLVNDLAEWRDNLFIVNQACGVWMYNNTSWQKLPVFMEEGETADNPFVIELHKDRLYVGDYSYGGVQEIMDDYTRAAVDSNSGVNGYYSKYTPLYVKALISTGEHLIVAGDYPGMPRVYMGDKGEPKGWRRLNGDSWCNAFRCIAQITYDFDVLNDTLYAAAWEGVFKFPLSDLDSAIATETSYPTFTGE